MKIDVTQVVVALIGILGTIITAYVIPYLKSKTNTTQWSNIIVWAKAGVQCAEIIYNGVGKGNEKLAYVEKYITDMCNKAGIKVDADTIRIAVENAWKTLGLDIKANDTKTV